MGTTVRPARRLAACAALLLPLLLAAPAVAGTNGTIGLAWDAPLPTDPHVDGWFIYWGSTPGGPYPNKSPAILNDGTSTPAYTLTGLTDCTMTYFVATAFAYVPEDDAGAILESAFSNEVSSWPSTTVTGITPATASQLASITMSIDGTNFGADGAPTVTFDDPAIVGGTVAVPDCYHVSLPVDVHCSRTGPIEVRVINVGGVNGVPISAFSVTPSSGCEPPDAGAEPPDAAAPGPDAAPPPGPDAARPGEDAAAPGEDAAEPPGEDASTSAEDASPAAPPDAAAPSDDAGPVVSLDAAAAPDGSLAARDAGASGLDGSAAASDAENGFPPSVVEAGCGCSASSAGSSGLAGAWLLLLALRRRRTH